ncbi:unnamed protein product [Durusdinium trenchii]|uniref:PARP-type domain-containing protein n=2 Tax=Durusdinium trenchii TaxID=1381693 RepID=A0ABP0K6T9_9DINO
MDGATTGYIAVAKGDADHIEVDGYRPKVRDHVPIAFSPTAAARARFRNHPEEEEMIVLEVHSVEEKLVDRELGRLNCTQLASRHLRSGMVFERKPVDYEDVPCHLCGGEIPPSERGKVGRWHFWKGAFLVIPCANLECRERQKERQEWLDATPPQTLYHQTDPESAKKILGSGKMIRGRCGVVGGGIYFAETPRETEWKAESKGIVLECQVKTGRHLLLDRSKEDPSLTFADLLRRGHDSVLMDRGVCMKGPHKGKKAGNEWIVYSWDQVQVLKEVPRDPVP